MGAIKAIGIYVLNTYLARIKLFTESASLKITIKIYGQIKMKLKYLLLSINYSHHKYVAISYRMRVGLRSARFDALLVLDFK